MNTTTTEEIVRQSHLLDDVNRRIHIAENELRGLYEEKSKLKHTIAVHRASIAPIHRCPTEILLEIFLHVTHCDHSHYSNSSPCGIHQIRSLMLVCKTWSQIVVNSYQLWSRICIIIRDMDPVVTWATRQKAYLDVCLARCRNAPLEVTIRVEAILWPDTYAIEQMTVAFQDVVPYPELEAYVNSIRWQETPICRAYCQIFAQIIEKLLGVDGSNMKECHTLNVRLANDEDILHSLWPLFNHPMPNLRSLLLATEKYTIDDMVQNAAMMTPSLARMTLSADFNLRCVPISRGLIELDLYLHSCAGFHYLNQLSSLRRLCLWADRELMGVNSAHTISLPQLEHLHLHGYIQGFLYHLFQFAHLPKLTLEIEIFHTPRVSDIPLFSVTEVLTYRLPISFQLSEHSHALETLLFKVFTQLHAAHTIEVPESVVDIALDIANQCRANHGLPELRLIQPIDASGRPCQGSHAFVSRDEDR